MTCYVSQRRGNLGDEEEDETAGSSSSSTTTTQGSTPEEIPSTSPPVLTHPTHSRRPHSLGTDAHKAAQLFGTALQQARALLGLGSPGLDGMLGWCLARGCACFCSAWERGEPEGHLHQRRASLGLPAKEGGLTDTPARLLTRQKGLRETRSRDRNIRVPEGERREGYVQYGGSRHPRVAAS